MFRLSLLGLNNPLWLVRQLSWRMPKAIYFDTEKNLQKLFHFILILRSYIVKELTQSEIEKTEHLSKVCSFLVANQTDTDRKLNFGVTASKRNMTYSTARPGTGNESDVTDMPLTTLFVNQNSTARCLFEFTL